MNTDHMLRSCPQNEGWDEEPLSRGELHELVALAHKGVSDPDSLTLEQIQGVSCGLVLVAEQLERASHAIG